ncbi:ACT domain-containing protein [Desulfitispora alkaliphila]|uniref:ACT domain-containing protein n=1 Tax=Desulfitispora alkaliphila TaxID=622674 RepID=UPI003D1A5446
MKKNNRIVVTVLGKDRVGIISGVANVLADANANIADISQTIMQDFFTMIMIVDIAGCNIDFNHLKSNLHNLGEELGVKITAQNEQVFDYMHRI